MSRVNNYNSQAIVSAQQAFAACTCAVCMSQPPNDSNVRCPAELKLWAEIERGEDMYIASLARQS